MCTVVLLHRGRDKMVLKDVMRRGSHAVGGDVTLDKRQVSSPLCGSAN